jgi:hypothetical protein
MALIFDDGVEIKDSGPYRIIEELDGLYVAGKGLLCPVNSREEGEMLIRELISPHHSGASKTH